jgi:DMSO/TMAO reductase YedYZ heme-binding membrane subunit
MKKLPYIFFVIAVSIVGMGYVNTGVSSDSLVGIGTDLAKLSFVLFMITYLSSSIHSSVAHGIGVLLIENRRYFGLSFGVVHIVHGLVIASYIYLYGADAISWITLVAGSLGYVVLIAMMVTSSDGCKENLGEKWHRLHNYGMHYLWFVFTYTFVTKAIENSGYAVVALFSITAFVYKIYIMKRSQN